MDIDIGDWSIPAERMKSRRKHRVPLSPQALDVLRRAEALGDRTGLVFPSITGRKLSDATLSKLLRELGVEAVPHGFRASFRMWAGEEGVAGAASAADVKHRSAIFFDLDDKDGDHSTTLEPLRAQRPHAIVRTGHGYHVWFRVQPKPQEDNALRLAVALKMHGSDAVGDAPRIRLHNDRRIADLWIRKNEKAPR